MAAQEVPFPEYPALQVQLNVPGADEVQVDPTAAQLLAPEVQLLMATQLYPSPLYPVWHAQLKVPGPV